jgi:hypothetical protein
MVIISNSGLYFVLCGRMEDSGCLNDSSRSCGRGPRQTTLKGIPYKYRLWTRGIVFVIIIQY